MKFGIFDHLERSEDRSLATQFDERIAFATAADKAGIYCLHVAEHHSSPLNMVPAPGIYLGAVARATETMRLGPLVYLLTLTTPLKLAEEVCILDHLSNGHFELGVGRGVSPFELNFHNVDHADSREIFFDAYDCLK
jgi:alkanesulfonate monooxygenase SsuD/methylene tetrahydromethanopterin reductase-like flavin-dependent oxidoreductase (luciferase family)